jgi:hypothetical protein
LRYYHAGSNGNRKPRSLTILGKILQKSPKTMRMELRRAMMENVVSDIPFSRT